MSADNIMQNLQKHLGDLPVAYEIINIGKCYIKAGRLVYDRDKITSDTKGIYFILDNNGILIDRVRYSSNSIRTILSQVNENKNDNGPTNYYHVIKKSLDENKKLNLYIIKSKNKKDIEKLRKHIEKFFEQNKSKKTQNISSEYQEIKKLLEFKKQIILQGAPGTGKTYTAKKVAEAMGCGYEVIQFHPSYTYEDFVRGIVSKTDENGYISYEVEDKILMNAIEKAKEHEKYILIIDEINRANLPSVLGELLYALEYREEPVICPYKKDKEDDGKIIIPKNLYIIGTMNTADRSIGSIDYAVRRRFAFYTVKANEDFIKDNYSKTVFKYIKNEIIEKHLSEEYYIDDIMIGHSYFIFSDEAYSDEDLAYKYMNLSLQYNIIPLLEEYYKDGILIDKENEKVLEKIKFNEIIKEAEKYSKVEQ